MSSKSVLQECQVRSVKYECLTRVSSRSVLEECQARVSHKWVLWKMWHIRVGIRVRGLHLVFFHICSYHIRVLTVSFIVITQYIKIDQILINFVDNVITCYIFTPVYWEDFSDSCFRVESMCGEVPKESMAVKRCEKTLKSNSMDSRSQYTRNGSKGGRQTLTLERKTTT